MAFDTEHEGEHDDSELLLTDEIPGDEEDQAPEGEEGQAQPAEQEDDGLELAIEGEDDGNETELVKRLRDQVRSAHGEIATLKRATAPTKIEVGKKPDLWEDCDGDPDRFESKLIEWQDRKRQAERQTAEHQDRQAETQREFDRLKSRHEARAAALKIPDFDVRQQAVIDALGPELAGAALVIADDSAKLIGALGGNSAALARIADEPNPLLKMKLLLKMEQKIVVNKKKPPAPEAATIQRGSAPAAQSKDKRLVALEKKALESGDRTELVRYRKQIAAKSA